MNGMLPADARALAQKFAEVGVPALPIGLSRSLEKGSIDKRPLSSPIAKNGFKDASTDPVRVEEMFLKARLGAGQHWGVGVRPGPAGFIVLDVDVKGGGTGLEDLARLTNELGPLPKAMAVDTPSGGLHYWLRRPERPEHIGNVNLAAGIEVRCDSGYVVAPGTTSPWGSWTRDPASSRLSEVEELPARWAEKLTEMRAAKAIGETIGQGSRNVDLTSYAGRFRNKGASEKELLALLRVANEDRCEPPLPDREVAQIAESVARYEPDGAGPDGIIPVRRQPQPDLGAKPGGSWIFDRPETVPAIWGEGDEVAWAEGETLMLVGPDGAGKTALAHQITSRLIGIDTSPLLGLHIEQRARVLYLALDRPAQAARAFKRIVGTMDRAVLDDRLKVIDHPIGMLDEDPGLLLKLSKNAGCDTVIVDSVKDAILEPSTEKSGQAVKASYQMAIAQGVEVCLLHHDRKAQQDGKRKLLRLSDVYGSRFLVAGCGSVISLNGGSGDPVIDLRHLKQPMAEVGPLTVALNFETGGFTLYDSVDLLAIIQGANHGITAQDAAKLLYGTDNPTKAERERARRKLKVLVGKGLVFETPPHNKNEHARYHVAASSKPILPYLNQNLAVAAAHVLSPYKGGQKP